jgi:hypothetical protein
MAITPPILASMKNGAGKRKINTIMLGKRTLNPNDTGTQIKPSGKHNEIVARGNNQYLTDEKWLRESDIRERNTMQKNKNFVRKLSSMAQPKVPLE